MFKKILFSTTMATALLAGGISASAQTVITSGDYRYVENGDGTATIHVYDGTENIIVVPDELNSLPVVGLQDTEIFSGLVDNRLREIERIEFGPNMVDLQPYSFNFSVVNSFSVSNENPVYRDIDGKGIYTKDRTKLVRGTTSGIIDPATQIIGQNAFAGAYPENISIPEGVLTIEDFAFNFNDTKSGYEDPNYDELEFVYDSIVLPSSLQTLGSGAFEYTNVSELVFLNPNTVINSTNGDILGSAPIMSTSIVGYEGSTAEAYAIQNGLTFNTLPAPVGNSDTSIDATVQVLPGTLTFANELVSVFADSVSLNGLSQTITAFFNDTIDVIDARGSHDGYDVQVGMSDLVSGSDVIGKENITFKNLSTISADGLVGSAIDQSGSSSFSLINFGAGQGIGQHVLDFSQAEMDIYLSEKTKTGLYTGAVTMSLVTSP